jgi:hypothetical protein
MKIKIFAILGVVMLTGCDIQQKQPKTAIDELVRQVPAAKLWLARNPNDPKAAEVRQVLIDMGELPRVSPTPTVAPEAERGADAQINFGPKAYADTGDKISVTGSLTGDDVPNNAVAVTCDRQRMECISCAVYQIGHNLTSRPYGPDIYTVRYWNAQEIIATLSDDFHCLKTTIKIERDFLTSGTVIWTEEPINQSSTSCKEQADLIRKGNLSPQRFRKFTIEDSPAYAETRKLLRSR